MSDDRIDMPSVEEVSGFAKEAFLALVTREYKVTADPTQQTRQTVDRLMKHAVQMAEAWASTASDVRKMHERIRQQHIRRNRVFK